MYILAALRQQEAKWKNRRRRLGNSWRLCVQRLSSSVARLLANGLAGRNG